MSKFRMCLIGDTHGDFAALEDLIEKVLIKGPLDRVCVVGDMGIYPRKQNWEYRIEELITIHQRWPELELEFIDGNHDDHIALSRPGFAEALFKASGWRFRERGEYDAEHGVLYVGGADSVWFDMISRLTTIGCHNEAAAYALIERTKAWPQNQSIRLAMKPRILAYNQIDMSDMLNTRTVAKAKGEIDRWLYHQHEKEPAKTFEMLREMLLEAEKHAGFRHWSIGEQLTEEELARALACPGPVKLIVSHTSPQQLCMDPYTLEDQIATDYEPTRHRLAKLYEAIQPEEWIFGHWHKPGRFSEPKTKFSLLATLSNDTNQCGRLLPDGLARYNDFHRIIEL